MVVRYENWPLLLSDYIKSKTDQPFQWGVNDCVSFAFGGVNVMTGISFMDQVPDYNDEQSAKEVLTGYGSIAGVIEYFLGEGNTNPLVAGRGDIVIVKMPEFAAGIVDDTGQYIVVVTRKGLKRVSLEKAKKVWKV